MNKLMLPPWLQPGDLLRVIAPSGRLLEQDAFWAGVDIWRSQGYRVELTAGWDARWGYLAGNDQGRRDALAEAWFDPDCKGILCARGGYGGMRLLENWDWKIDQVTPKWLIGFSDITSLLWSLGTVGIASIHGPVLTTFAAEPDWSRQRLFDFLAGKPLEVLQGKGWGNGQAEGILLPANLTVATHILKTPLQPNFKNVILALEDVTEAPYRIDRLLTQWRLLGAFEKIKGIALGRFSQCDELGSADSFSVMEVLGDRLQDLNIPIVAELSFGHDGINAALPVGVPVILDGDRGLLFFPEKPTPH
ncbi:S66 peptidase family protein [Synechococcus sp. BDU 130192]|uniref:S66 peptidase family protein n=1 Tax=Synechococcus sp. BDU 130192 TaxID=2042059 RepID=UPI00156E3456|nr:LD-carboxypeptidase [Synechococcus sp. BDU 130192]